MSREGISLLVIHRQLGQADPAAGSVDSDRRLLLMAAVELVAMTSRERLHVFVDEPLRSSRG